MCGICGYTGGSQAADILIEGLERLEYRGYDSAGIAVLNGGALAVRKMCGRVEVLKNICAQNSVCGTTGIGHTRWATHGEANTVNSHPHTNLSGTIAVVHNGIIENNVKLRSFLVEKGYRFVSQTDTEVIPHLIDYYYRECFDFLGAVRCAVSDLEGSYAISVICSDCPGKIIAVCHRSPLVIGLGDGENYLSSDINSFAGKTNKMYILDNGEIAVVTSEGVSIYDEKGIPVNKEIYHSNAHTCNYDIDVCDHYMLKEIYQQPHILRQIISTNVFADKKTCFGGLEYRDIENIEKIFIVGCGTAYHAACMGKYIIEKYAGIPVETDVASQFRYRNPIINEKTLVIAITQSGETADTLAAMELAKNSNSKVMSITNTPRSSATRLADFTFLTTAGPEVSVASTKAYTAQLATVYILSLFLSENIKKEENSVLKNALLRLPKDITSALALEDKIKDVAKSLVKCEHLYYIGRGKDSVTADEGALKMKEITYIHAESYPAGELKHGPIALIDEKSVVIAVSTDKELHSKMMSNISEVVARGAKVLCISPYEVPEASLTVKIPDVHTDLFPFTSVVVMQLLSYYTAVLRGCDVDKPRNLAKSVTVE